MRIEITDLLDGYEQFLPFDRRELALIEPLRALRMIHYSAWLARRWDDPAFPGPFPGLRSPATGRNTIAPWRISWRRCSSRRSSCDRPALFWRS